MESKNYNALDLVKYICTILVIVVHTAPLLPYNETANWMLMTILGRFTVPFFFICAGYFICLNTQRKGDGYFKHYIMALIKTYLIWSLIYLPLGIDYIGAQFDIPWFLYPIALLVALFYVGTYFHLWYIPALILALLLVHWFMKHFRKRYLLGFSFLLFLLGALETYYGFIQNEFILSILKGYFSIFFTTRNGLFFGFFYVAWGYFIAQKNTWLTKTKHHGYAAIFFFVLTILEANLIFESNNLDSNILLSAAPFTICLFLYCKDLHITWKLPYMKLREYSSLYYFTHAYFLVIIPFILNIFHIQWLYLDHGIFRFISVFICTHVISMLIYHINDVIKRRRRQKLL